jgi:hypothetical protein
MATTIYEQLSAVIASMQQVYDLADQVIAGPAGATVTYPDGSTINTLRESLAQFQANLDAITGQASTDANFVNNLVSQFFGGLAAADAPGVVSNADGALQKSSLIVSANAALDDVNTYPVGFSLHANNNGTAPTNGYSGVATFRTGRGGAALQIAYQWADISGNLSPLLWIRTHRDVAGSFSSWVAILSSNNTTIDSNGFIKAASPIAKLYADKVANDGGAAAVFTKIATGHYKLTGTNGLSQDGWFVQSPTDANGTIKCFIEYAQNADNSIEVWTYQPLFDQGFAQAGPPMDIPAGRWIDIRLNEPDVKNVTPPPSAVPLTDAQKLDRWRAQTAVSKLQLIRAINAAGKRSQFNTALTAADQDTQDGWNYASQINRNDPLVAAFAQSTGGTATDVDALFKAAAGAT